MMDPCTDRDKGYNMGMIRDIKNDGWAVLGRFDAKTLFPGEMDIMIFEEDGAGLDDAEKCIAHFNSLADRPEVTEAIEKRLKKFFLYMYDEWDAMGIYHNITESLKPVMQEYRKGTRLSTFLSNPCMIIFPQKNGDIGYGIQTDCPWEPEHQCLILMRNDECVYAASFEMLDPWSDEKYLHCIWDD